MEESSMQNPAENLQNISFEDALALLEQIVRELEGGRIKLDDAVSAYEKATALKKLCSDRLATAALKVEKIKVGKDGNLSIEPLDNMETDKSAV